MLKAIALGIAAGIVLTGPVWAHPLRLSAAAPAVFLVKHDKDEDGPGKKLGHYKHRGGDDRSWSSTTRTYVVPVPVYPPAYGSSRPPGYYEPPAYLVPPPY